MTSLKLPLIHPDYRYAPSKNPYSEKLKEFAGWAYSDNETEQHAGDWRKKALDEKTSKSRPLIVEVGCNTGHVVRAWAEKHTKPLFIGIDWKFKIIYRGAEKAKAKGLKNLLFFRGNVERIHYMFGEAEIDELHMYFPDPWPKKPQWKNRTIQESFLRNAAYAVKPGGIFFIKTDHDAYFEWMKKEFGKVKESWEIEKITHDLHSDHKDPKTLEIPEVTLFEKLFIKDGIPIKAVWLRRLPASP